MCESVHQYDMYVVNCDRITRRDNRGLINIHDFHVYIIVDTVDIDKDGFTETLLWDERYDMLFVRSVVSSREAKDVQKLMDHGFQT